MKVICPNCFTEDGIREAIYGMPAYPLDLSKYFVAGCTSSGPDLICIQCQWGIKSEENDEDL